MSLTSAPLGGGSRLGGRSRVGVRHRLGVLGCCVAVVEWRVTVAGLRSMPWSCRWGAVGVDGGCEQVSGCGHAGSRCCGL